MIDQALLSRVQSLSPSERLELIGAVWESLDLSDVPVGDEERAILDARIEDEAKNPTDVSPWPEAEARLRQRLR
jgi:putative addiction module component (TIGR02574 family)